MFQPLEFSVVRVTTGVYTVLACTMYSANKAVVFLTRESYTPLCQPVEPVDTQGVPRVEIKVGAQDFTSSPFSVLFSPSHLWPETVQPASVSH